jgi:hypothetical protein
MSLLVGWEINLNNETSKSVVRISNDNGATFGWMLKVATNETTA